jgi:dTDP-4-dehydrorhamnose 3,5-epimerase
MDSMENREKSTVNGVSVIEGLEVITSKVGVDARGTVREFYRRSRGERLPDSIAERGWSQINVTESVLGAIRGLHGEEMAKMVGVVSGSAFGVWVDARRASPTFGAVVTKVLEPGLQVFVPAGVLNGFQSLSDPSQYLYCFTAEWSVDMTGVRVNPLDATLAIPWPIDIDSENSALLSEKDHGAPSWTSTLEIL